MPKFSRRSREKLKTCHPDLQEIMNEVIKNLDISIISGHRGALEQDSLYDQGFSKVQFPNSKHNNQPSNAVDVVIYNKERPHIRWDDKVQMAYLAGYIKAVADSKGIKIRQGADFNMNLDFHDGWFDGAHLELKDD